MASAGSRLARATTTRRCAGNARLTAEGREPSAIAFIAVDWGTTSARAYAVDSSGSVSATRHAPLGVQQLRGADFAQAFARLLGDWATLHVPRFAAGMIGSRQGWEEAPYVACPAAFDSLAERLAWTPGRELAIVPGLIAREIGRASCRERVESAGVAGVLKKER